MPQGSHHGDYQPTCKIARKLTREHGLEKKHAAEEFLKLCLDMELGVDVARSVRSAVMKVR